MSKVGGYAILDLKDTPLVAAAPDGVQIAGAYSQARAAMANRKAVLVSGIRLAPSGEAATAAVPYPDTFGAVWDNAANTLSVRCIINGGAAQVHVSNNDEVTIEVS